jgi:hypothetical protein
MAKSMPPLLLLLGNEFCAVSTIMTLDLQCRWTEERLFSLYHRCGRGRALHAHGEADGLAVAAVFPQDILA